MKIGRKIYFDKATGNVLVDTGERSGDVVETTVEQDFESYLSLKERVPSTVGTLQLEYGQYSQDFAVCDGYRINLVTKQLEFTYPDPKEPEKPPVYVKPLTEQIAELEQKNKLLEAQKNALADRADFHEDLIAELAMLVYQ